MALEELDVIIQIVDSFSEEINELLADLQTVDFEAGRVEDLYIDVDVLGEREIAELESSLTAITDETVTLDVDTIGEEDVSNLKRQLSTLTDELINVNVETLGEYEIAQLEAQLSSLTDKTVNIDANNLTADELAEIQTSLASIENTTVKIDANNAALDEIAQIEGALQSITDKDVTVDVDSVDNRELLALQTQLSSLSDESLTVDIDNLTEDEITSIQSSLNTLTDESISVDINNLTGNELAHIRAGLASLTDKNVTADVDVTGRGEILEAIGLLTTMRALAAGDMDIGSGDFDPADLFGGGGNRVGGPARGDIPEGGLLSLRMSDLHNAMAKLIPLVLVYVGALPAAIGGLLGLATAAASAAAALGALTGLAGYGFALQAGDGNVMQGLQEITDRIQEDFADAFEPLARDLAPLFEDALDGLERFFDTLASHGDILRSLTDDARAFGAFMSEYIVGIATTMGTLADTAAPLFSLLGDVVEDLDLIEGFAGFLSEVLPSLVAFGSALAHIITRLANLSVGFLQVATMATRFLDIFLEVITLGGAFNNVIGRGIAALLGLITVGSILKATFASSLVPAVWSFVSSLQMLSGYSAIAQTATYMLNNAISFLRANLVKTAITAAVVTGGLYAIAIAAGAIAGQFMSTSDAIDDATDSLKEFQNLQGDMDGGMGGGSVVYQFAPTSQRTTINEQNVQDAYRTVKTKQFNDADIPS